MNKRDIDFDQDKLQALANKLSEHFWQEALHIPVVWNGRLTRAMGRFLFQQKGKRREPVKIEMSKYAAFISLLMFQD